MLTIIGLLVWIASLAASIIGAEIVSQIGAVGRAVPSDWSRILGLALGLINTLFAAACFLTARRRRLRHDDLLRLSYVLVAADGMIRVGLAHLGTPGALGIVGVLLTHTLACAFLPWSPRQALRPVWPVVVVWAILHVAFGGVGRIEVWFGVLFSPFVAAPGVLICYLRDTSRLAEFKLRFFQKRYGEVRRELVDARRIHESLFPRPIKDGPILLSYEYEPMSQIGGDYLFAHRVQPRDDALGCLSVVVLDVTGHGISAALTVNRLYGELTRIFAEQPHVRPGEVLRLLNRYIHLTLADHSVFVTGLCLRADLDADIIEYANGGHPPAFLRAVDGTLHELESTAWVLGASGDTEFVPAPRTIPFGPGDSLIAYTDGAIECRGIDGALMSLAGLRRLIAAARTEHGGWPALVRNAVLGHRAGPPTDDTLVIEVSRSLTAASSTSRAGSRSRGGSSLVR